MYIYPYVIKKEVVNILKKLVRLRSEFQLTVHTLHSKKEKKRALGSERTGVLMNVVHETRKIKSWENGQKNCRTWPTWVSRNNSQ